MCEINCILNYYSKLNLRVLEEFTERAARARRGCAGWDGRGGRVWPGCRWGGRRRVTGDVPGCGAAVGLQRVTDHPVIGCLLTAGVLLHLASSTHAGAPTTHTWQAQTQEAGCRHEMSSHTNVSLTATEQRHARAASTPAPTALSLGVVLKVLHSKSDDQSVQWRKRKLGADLTDVDGNDVPCCLKPYALVLIGWLDHHVVQGTL